MFAEPGTASGKEVDASQEVFEDTLRQIAKSVSDNLKSSHLAVEASSAVKEKTTEKPATETKTATTPESSKPPNKKGKNKK